MATFGLEERVCPPENEQADRLSTGISLRDDFSYLAGAVEMSVDFITVICAALASDWIYRSLRIGLRISYDLETLLGAAVIFAITMVFLLERQGTYRAQGSLMRIRETERIMRASVFCGAIMSVLMFMAGELFSRWLVSIALFVVTGALILEKHALHSAMTLLRSRGVRTRRVLVYGAGQTGRRVASILFRSPKLRLLPVAIVDDDQMLLGTDVCNSGYNHETILSVSAGPLTPELISSFGAELVVVAIPTLAQEKLLEICSLAESAGANTAFVPNCAVRNERWLDFTDIDGLVLSFFSRPRSPLGYELWKRVIDLVVSSIVITLSSPILVLIGILVKLDSRGSALFVQERVGKDGRSFLLYKFRTMYVEKCGESFSPTDSDDIRITRIGRWLRRTSLDELPQLINVFRGEMSLVGPRPEMPFIVNTYTSHERKRLAVLPGITGFWQLSAARSLLIHENIQYDMYYIRNRNIFMDIAILIHTVFFAMRGI